MARTLKSDTPLFLLTMLLVGFGLVMVYSASFVMAADRFDSGYHFFYRQACWALIGLMGMLGVMRIDYRRYNRPAVIWTLLGVTLLALAAVLVTGPKINGTRRWFSLGGLMSFQPSEVAKLVAVLFTAAVLDRRMHRIGSIRTTLLPIAFATLSLVLLIVTEPDFGTSAVIVCVVMAMAYSAGLAYRHLVALFVPIVVAAVGLVAFEPYRLARITSFLDPWSDPQGAGYQAVQSMLAIASGGLLGRGLMQGQQKIYFLPEPHTDFIFSVVGEELGLVGTTLLLVAFALLAWRGLRIALLAPDRFGSLVALGLTLIVAVQALVNVSVVTAVMPPKGIALPFVSNGGSSLLINMIGMGILLNISQHASVAAAAPARASDWSIRRQEAPGA